MVDTPNDHDTVDELHPFAEHIDSLEDEYENTLPFGDLSEWEQVTRKYQSETYYDREQCPECEEYNSLLRTVDFFGDAIHEDRLCTNCRTKWCNRYGQHRKVIKDTEP